MGNLSQVARFFSLEIEVKQDIADLIISVIQAELTLFDTTADILEELGVYFYAVDHTKKKVILWKILKSRATQLRA